MELALKNRRLFKRFLISFFSIFLIPFLTILLIYNMAGSMIREEISRSNSNSLYQFYNGLDVSLSDAYSSAQQVISSSPFRNYAIRGRLENPTQGTDVYMLKNYLHAHQNEQISDIIVYYPLSDLVVSQSRACLKSRLFWRTYYSEAFPKYEDFVFLLNQPSLKGVSLINFGAGNQSTLAAVSTSWVSLTADSNHYSVFVLLNPQKISQKVAQVCSRTEGLFFMYDEAGSCLLSSEAVNLSIDLNALRASEDYLPASIDGQDYILQMCESDLTRCAYVSAVPVSVFWQRMNRLSMLSLISILLCLLISIIVSLILAQHNYRPIGELVRVASEHSGIDYEHQNDGELEYLAHVLDSSITRSDLLATQLDRQGRAMMENFWVHAMHGTLQTEEMPEDVFASNNISLLSDAFCMVLFQFEEYLHADTFDVQRANQLDDFFREQIDGHVAAPHQIFAVPLSPSISALMFNYAASQDSSRYANDTDDICRRLNQELYVQFGLHCTIAISLVHHGLSGIHLCYDEAVSALRYRFLRGKGSVNHFTLEHDKSFFYEALFDTGPSNILLQAVKGDSPINQSFAQTLLDAAHIHPDTALEAVECYRYDLISVLNKIILDINATRLERENHLLSNLFQADTLEQFQDKLLEALSLLQAFHHETEKADNVCSHALHLIEENYTDTQLNNNVIADRLGITSSYLSRLFRLQYGQSMMDCLYKLRINRSKQLLRESQLNVDEIAVRCGFVSGNTLIKMFKKYEGITPGIYRRIDSESERDAASDASSDE